MKRFKDIFKLALCLSAVALLFSLSSCGDKPYELELPLAVSQHNLSFPSSSGTNHILVYCTGDWTVGFDREIDWGTLSKTSGSGNSDFIFYYNANYGISRRVTIRLASGNLRDSIVVSQSGPMSVAIVEFKDASVTVADTAATVTVGFSTDLIFAGCDFKAKVVYYDEDGRASDPVQLRTRADGDESEGEDEDEEEETPAVVVDPWISNVVVTADTVSFDVEVNKNDTSRRASLTVYIADNSGTEYSSTINITQLQASRTY